MTEKREEGLRCSCTASVNNKAKQQHTSTPSSQLCCCFLLQCRCACACVWVCVVRNRTTAQRKNNERAPHARYTTLHTAQHTAHDTTCTKKGRRKGNSKQKSCFCAHVPSLWFRKLITSLFVFVVKSTTEYTVGSEFLSE